MKRLFLIADRKPRPAALPIVQANDTIGRFRFHAIFKHHA